MASTCSATVTAKVGPGNTLTAVVIKNITKFDFDVANQKFIYEVGDQINTLDISLATTVTCTLSAAAGNYTLTVS